MDAFLFLSSEYLRRMTDPAVSSEEQEDIRSTLTSFLHGDEGRRGEKQLVEAFNSLKPEELRGFLMETLTWFLDWVTQQRPEMTQAVEPTFLEILWLTFDDEVVRTRTIEVIVQSEEARQVRPQRSSIVNLARAGLHVEEGEEHLVSEAALEAQRGIIDTLLTEQGYYSLRLLRDCATSDLLPPRIRQFWLKHIYSRLEELGEEDGQELRRRIFPKDER
jgi:hypothetical protein